MNTIYTASDLLYEDTMTTMADPDREIKGFVLKTSDGRFRVVRALGAGRYESKLITSDYQKAKEELSLVVYGTKAGVTL
jgi:hypothetical protein